MKTKAQLNWEIGKEQEERFIEENYNILGRDRERLKLLFQQIRQNEYRRGKEEGEKEARKEFFKIIDKEFPQCICGDGDIKKDCPNELIEIWSDNLNYNIKLQLGDKK